MKGVKAGRLGRGSAEDEVGRRGRIRDGVAGVAGYARWSRARRALESQAALAGVAGVACWGRSCAAGIGLG